MMKRQKIGMLIGLLLLLSGCTESKGWTGKISDSFGLDNPPHTLSDSTKLFVDDIKFPTLELISTPDEEGYRLEGQFQNNSHQIIRWLNLNVTLPDGMKQTLSFYFTVNPNEKSPIIQKDVGSPTVPKEPILNNRGEKSPTVPKEPILNGRDEIKELVLDEKGEEIQIIESLPEDKDLSSLTKESEQKILINSISVEYISINQMSYYYHYETKTKTERWSENGPFVSEIPPFEVEDLHLQELQLIDNEIEQTFYMSAYLKNNSIYKVSEITYTYLLPDGTVDSLSTYQRLYPGERSTRVYAKGPESLDVDDLELLKITYTIEEEKEQIHVEYDVLLDFYLVHHQTK